MLGYFFVFIGIALFTALCKKRGKERTAIFILGITLFFVYLALDKYRIHDVGLYERSFNEYKRHSLFHIGQIDTYEEAGFVAFNIVCSKIVDSFWFCYYAYALIVIVAFSTLLKNYSINLWLSGVLLICSFFYPLFLMRQYLAIAICLYSLTFVFKRRPIEFALCMAAAFLFHKSSIVFSICYFLPYIKLNYKTLILTLIAGGLVLSSIGFFNMFMVDMVMESDMASHYEAYLNLNEDSANSWKASAVAIADFIFVFLCYRSHFKELNTKQSFFFFMCAIYAILSILGSMGTVFSAMYRILPYFSLSIIVLLPDAVNFIKSKHLRLIASSVIVVLYMFSIYSTAGPWFYLKF